MVQKNFETGMYVIDQNFQIINLNATMAALYPGVKLGDYCYRAIALQECQCAVCPLKEDNALFYNSLRKSWVHANAAVMEYPGYGECYNVQFQIRQSAFGAGSKLLTREELESQIRSLSGGSVDVCVVGAYCQPGYPLAYANQQMLQFLGYSDLEEMDQAVDGLVSNLIHPDDLDQVSQDMKTVGTQGGSFETTGRIHREDHSWCAVVAHGTRVQLPSGEEILLCILTEMAEFMKRQNDLLLENEALVQKGRESQEAMSFIPSGYHRCADDEGYSFLFVSKSFEQLVGYTWEQIRRELDNKYINLVIPEDLPRFAQLESDISHHGNGDVAYRIRRRDGQIRWVQDSTMAIEWAGKPGFQCTIADITDFVEQQAEFTRRKIQFDMVAKNVPCGYHRCTVDNGFHLEFVSDDFLDIMGYDRQEDLLGKPFLDFVAPEDQAMFMSHEPILARDGRVELVYRICRKDGTIRWVKDSTMRIQYNGKDTYQCILADITEHVESLNEARAQAEASNQAKSTFLFNASHDIRTPMNAIQGFAHIIEKNAAEPAVVLDAVQKLKRSGDILLTLMDDVLELSRIEHGKETVNLQPLDMQSHVEKLYEMMEQEMKESGICFRMENRIQHPLVLADDLKLTRIAMNFLSNARKFTPAGGSVSFGVEEARYNGQTAEYTLFVQDTGIGMSKEFQEHAFEQFERERTSTASGVTGSGLGLSITKRLADLLGGECGMESELGKGTRMTSRVTMALAREEEFQTECICCDGDFTGKRILLVEDNDFNREIARYVFEDLGCLVEEAIHGAQCIQKLTATEPGYYDLILMDLQMPIMDGYQATAEIRRSSQPAIAAIPIVAMTANAFAEDRKRCLAFGMDGHIPKPLDGDTVRKELTRVLRKEDKDA